MNATCWATPLNRKERRRLSRALSRASDRSRMAARDASRRGDGEQSLAMTLTWAEIANLRTDVVTVRSGRAR